MANERRQNLTAWQAVIRPQTPWRWHHVPSDLPNGFMQQKCDRQLCDIESCERYGNCGSASAGRSRELTAGKLTPKLSHRIADIRVGSGRLVAVLATDDFAAAKPTFKPPVRDHAGQPAMRCRSG